MILEARKSNEYKACRKKNGEKKQKKKKQAEKANNP